MRIDAATRVIYHNPAISAARVMATYAAAGDWWLANGTIDAGNVAEVVESPTQGQAYAGGTLSGAWTIAARTTYVASSAYVFDAQTGRVILGNGTGNGYYDGSWRNIGLFTTGDHVYFLVSDGANIQAYRDNSTVGSSSSSAVDIGGTATWRSRYVGTSDFWAAAVPGAAVYNIALDSTQRSNLYSRMAAL